MKSLGCRAGLHVWSDPVLVGGGRGDEILFICHRCKKTRPPRERIYREAKR